MQIDLSDKTAIVTASTKGIGLATAKGLAAAGTTVVLNGRTKESIDAAIASLRGSGRGAVRGVVADIGTAAGCATLIEAEPVADILVNNVAYVAWGDFNEIADEAWNQSWQTNVMAPVKLCRHYLQGMKAANWGRVVFVSSESARNIQPDLVAYGATKLATHALSRGLAKHVAGTGVTVNVVVPGPTLSDGVRRMVQPMVDQGIPAEQAGKDFVLAHRSSSVIKRMATVEEVASMIVYVCSPQASATSGAALRVDGGVVDDVN